MNSTLWHDLLDFMALDVAYAIRRLLPADIKRLYTHQPPPAAERLKELQANPFAPDYPISLNDEKGGLNVSEHVVYGCLVEQQWTQAMDTALRAQPWQCTRCDTELEEFDVLEQLVHQQQQCRGRKRKASTSKETASASASVSQSSSSSAAAAGGYYCETCQRQLQLRSQIDILRHRRQCPKAK